MGSSLPNHDAKEQKGQQKRDKRQKQKKNPKADYIKHS